MVQRFQACSVVVSIIFIFIFIFIFGQKSRAKQHALLATFHCTACAGSPHRRCRELYRYVLAFGPGHPQHSLFRAFCQGTCPCCLRICVRSECACCALLGTLPGAGISGPPVALAVDASKGPSALKSALRFL